MEQRTVIITGENVRNIVPEFMAQYRPTFKLESHSGQSYLFMREHYFLRTNSNSTASTHIDFKSDTICSVTMVSSGGGTSMLNLDWHSEKSMLTQTMKGIEKIVDRNGWRMESGKIKQPDAPLRLSRTDFRDVRKDESGEVSVVSFPHFTKCPACSGKLKVANPGRFRCPRCKVMHRIDQFGAIKRTTTKSK